MYGHKSFLRIGELSDSSISGLYRDSYELAHCDFGFEQGVDTNGKVQTEVKGGSISCTFTNTPSTEMILWMLNSSKLEGGAIIVCDANNEPVEKILFEDAACIEMDIDYSQEGNGFTSTQITLQTRKITIGETTLENNWKNL